MGTRSKGDWWRTKQHWVNINVNEEFVRPLKNLPCPRFASKRKKRKYRKLRRRK